MKKIIYLASLITVILFLVSCGEKKKNMNEEEAIATEAPQEAQAGVDVILQGEALVKASDCKTCHHKTNKIIGPAHLDVAKKYEFTEANVKLLAGKIITGGAGVWGEVPMNAHADLSQADAEKMAKYVLSLDGEKEH